MRCTLLTELGTNPSLCISKNRRIMLILLSLPIPKGEYEAGADEVGIKDVRT